MLNALAKDVMCLLLLELYEMPHEFLTFGLLLISVRAHQGLSKMWRTSWNPHKDQGKTGLVAEKVGASPRSEEMEE